MIPNPWLLLFCVCAVLAVLGTTAGFIKERLWLSEPLICAGLGIAVGPVGLGLLRLDPGSDPLSAKVVEEAARVTLAVAVTSAAFRLPPGWLRAQWRGLAVVLGPGMVAMAATGAAVAHWALGLPVPASLMVGAAIAPTDPVLSAPTLTGRLARASVPDDMRHALTAESGMNDGLALPLVLLPALFFLRDPGEAGAAWAAAVLKDVGLAALVGVALGWAASACLNWADRHPAVEKTSMVTAVLALALTSLAGARAFGGDGVLAAFAAGAVVNARLRTGEAEGQARQFQEAFTRFFDLPVMVVFGAAIPWAAWTGMGWGAAAFAPGVLLLRRLPAWLVLHRLMPWIQGWRGACFAGWFGPIGAAALLYAMELQHRTELDALWPAISLAVGASILVHGVTSTPLTRLLGRGTAG